MSKKLKNLVVILWCVTGVLVVSVVALLYSLIFVTYNEYDHDTVCNLAFANFMMAIVTGYAAWSIELFKTEKR